MASRSPARIARRSRLSRVVAGASPHRAAICGIRTGAGRGCAVAQARAGARTQGQLAYALHQMLVLQQHEMLRARCPPARSGALWRSPDRPVGSGRIRLSIFAAARLRHGRAAQPHDPEGRAWNYALLDPAQMDASEAHRDGALRLFLARVDKMFRRVRRHPRRPSARSGLSLGLSSRSA